MKRLAAVLTLLASMVAALPALANGDGGGWDDMPIDTTTTTVAPSTTTTTTPEPDPTTTSTTSTTTPAPDPDPEPDPEPDPTTTSTTSTTTPTTTPTRTSTRTTTPPPPTPDPVVELPTPEATAALDCEAGDVVVTLTNTGQAVATFTVRAVATSGETSETVDVAPGDEVVGTVDLDPLDEDSNVEVTVTAPVGDDEYVYTETFQVDCVDNPVETITEVVEIPTPMVAEFQTQSEEVQEECCECVCCEHDHDDAALVNALGRLGMAVLAAAAIGGLSLIAAAAIKRGGRDDETGEEADDTDNEN